MSEAHTGAGDIGRRVAHRRQELGLSREELAERCDMAPGYIAYLEEKPAVVPPDTLTKLAGGLETTPRQLLGGLAERPPGATPGGPPGSTCIASSARAGVTSSRASTAARIRRRPRR